MGLENLLLREALIGDEARLFLSSNVGRRVLSCVESRRRAALDRLAVVDPCDPDEIRRLQNEIGLCDMFVGFINDCIVSGDNAVEGLESVGYENTFE